VPLNTKFNPIVVVVSEIKHAGRRTELIFRSRRPLTQYSVLLACTQGSRPRAIYLVLLNPKIK